MNANAKLGCQIIPNDPNKISENGTIFLDIIKRQNLFVLNSVEKCEGTITRHRKTVAGDDKICTGLSVGV